MTVAPDLGTLVSPTSSDDIADYSWDHQASYRGDTVEIRARQELLEFIAAERGEVVFDAGCGTALTALLLSSRVVRVIGMDYESEAVRRARARLSRAGVSNVSVMRGDIAAVPLTDRSVDRVVCLSVLQYFDDDGVRRVLREFQRLLRPDGQLILHVKNRDSLYAITLLAARRFLGAIQPRSVSRYQMRGFDWYIRELNDAGFQLSGYNSFNLFFVERMPHWLFAALNALEVTQRRRFPFSSGFIRRRGLDLKVRAKLVATDTPQS